MSVELELRLRGPHAGMDAQESLRTVQSVLSLLRELENSETARSSRHGTRWSFNELRLGSVTCVLEPLRIAEHSDYQVVERVLRTAVTGLGEAETAERIPTGWTARAASLGQQVARSLGASPDVGMFVAVRADGVEVRTAEVTQRTAFNLQAATRARLRTSARGGDVSAAWWRESIAVPGRCCAPRSAGK